MIFVWGGLCLAASLLVVLTGGPSHAPVLTLCAYLGGTAGAWIAAQISKGDGGTWVFAWMVALGVRLALFFLPAGDDAYRYLWEGKIQWERFNPYQVPPNHPTLDAFADGYRSQVNHPEMTAIYGPLTLLFNAAAVRLVYSPWIFKVLFFILDLGLLGILSRRGVQPVIAYGWSVLPAMFLAGQAHNEILWVLPFVAAVSLLPERPAMAAIALGVAVAFKPTALIPVVFLLPARSPRHVLLTLTVPVLTLLPYVVAGWGLVRSLGEFAIKFEYNDLVPWVVGHLPGLAWASRPVALLVLAGIWWRVRREPVTSRALTGSGSMLLALPTVHPWYAVALAALASWNLKSRWWFLILGLGFYFLNHVAINRAGEWTEFPWVRALVFGPLLLSFCVRKRSHPAKLDPQTCHSGGKPW